MYVSNFGLRSHLRRHWSLRRLRRTSMIVRCAFAWHYICIYWFSPLCIVYLSSFKQGIEIKGPCPRLMVHCEHKHGHYITCSKYTEWTCLLIRNILLCTNTLKKYHNNTSFIPSLQSADDSFLLPKGILGKEKAGKEDWMANSEEMNKAAILDIFCRGRGRYRWR